MSRQKPESFDPTNLQSAYKTSKAMARKQKRLERYNINRILDDQDYFEYISLRNSGYYDQIDINELISLEEQSNDLEDLPAPEELSCTEREPKLSPDEFYELYESFIYQCPTAICPGKVLSNDNENFICSNSECPFKLCTSPFPIDRENLINLIKPKYIDHLRVECNNCPSAFLLSDKLTVYCLICEFYAEAI